MESFSVVIPAYNEEEVLEETVERILESADEIVIVEDGCTDRTPEIAEDLSEKYEKVKHLHSESKLGKGGALFEGFESCENDLMAFMDADLSTDPKHIENLISSLDKETGLVIGSRYLKESNADRLKKRELPSRIYNFLASTSLRTGIKDHQCGFKAVEKDVFKEVKDSIESRGWFWDTELIYRVKQRGYSIKEIPIDWEKDADSEVDLFTATKNMLKGLYRLNREKRPAFFKYLKFAAVGAFGAVLNTAVLFSLTEFFDLYYILSSIFAVETAIIVMFFLNNHLTFDSTKQSIRSISEGIVRSNMVRSVGIGINIGLLFVLTELGLYYIISNILAIFVASIANFIGEKKFNWKE